MDTYLANYSGLNSTFAKSSPEEEFLRRLFSDLAEANIRFAVMRNHETLPFSAGGSDLDILVLPADGQRVRSVILESIRASGGLPLGVADSIGFFKVYAIGRTPGKNGAWWGLRIDINTGLFFRGLRMLDEAAALPRQMHREIPVLSDGFAGVLGVLKEVLNNGYFPKRYAVAARQAASSDWQEIETLLAPMGHQALDRLRAMLLSDAGPDQLQLECSRLRQDFFRYARSLGAVSYAKQRLAFGWSKMRRYLRPSGVVMAILGVDGAGKSTVIDAILPALNAATHNAVVVQHLRPSVLPALARLKGKNAMPSGPVREPHGATPSGVLGSLLRLAYLTLDYVLGYWLWTRPKIAKQPTVLVFDRYAYDMALDPRRFRIGLSGRVAAWFAALAPKPDMIVCLHGSPEVIAARKGELSEAETRRQINALRDFAGREKRAVLVSTDTSVEETRDQVLNALMVFLQTKVEKRS